jgi:signal peptidase I
VSRQKSALEEKTVPAPALPAEPSAKTKSSTEVNRGVIAEWTVTIILLLFGTTTLVQAFVIPTGSMEDTLLVGDHLLVDKLAFAPAGAVSKYVLPYSDVKRGDIIVFRYPIDIKQTFVKRAIGVAGDHIKLVNKQLFLNGHSVNEPYKVNKSGYSMVYAPALQMLQNNQVNGEIVVPPNSVFAMGDNRDFSLDSRYWGFVPRENIIGKPLVIYWSYDAPTEQLASSSIGVAHLEDLALHFFSKTRWSRTLKFPHSYPLQ